MGSRDDYRAAAQRYLQMAAEATDPEIASLLRMLSEDCLEQAAGTSAQQQQQIQPKDPEHEGQ